MGRTRCSARDLGWPAPLRRARRLRRLRPLSLSLPLLAKRLCRAGGLALPLLPLLLALVIGSSCERSLQALRRLQGCSVARHHPPTQSHAHPSLWRKQRNERSQRKRHKCIIYKRFA